MAKKIIRKGTFETNSSSTHSLTMCMKDDYEKWCNGETVLVEDDWQFTCKIKEQFISKEKAIDLLKHNYKYLPENMNWDDEGMVDEQLSESGLKCAGGTYHE